MKKLSWKLLNPEGVERRGEDKSRQNPRQGDLSGKTVVLHWNGKHNGDIFLNRIAALLLERFPGVKVVRSWEAVPFAMQISHNPGTSTKIAGMLADLKPDLVLGAQGD